MTCYCAYMTFDTKDAMNHFMDWVVANQQAFPIIRGKAWPEPPRWHHGNEFASSEKWRARIVLRAEDDVRRLYRQWAPDYSDDWEIEPWR